MDGFKKSLLTYFQTVELLEKYHLDYVQGIVSNDANDLRWNFLKMKKPVVLKASGTGIFHKTEKGQVILNINSPEELDGAVKQIKNSTNNSNDLQYLLQPQITGGEVVVGAKRDESFGPVIMFGMGGVYAQMINDVSIRLAPVTKNVANQLILSTKANAFCQGFRTIKVERKILENFLVNSSKLIANEKNVIEFDFNPVIVSQMGAKIVDAKIFVATDD